MIKRTVFSTANFSLRRKPKDRYDLDAYRRGVKLKKMRRILLSVLSLVILLGALIGGIYLYRNYDVDNLAQTLTGSQNEGTVLSTSFPISMSGEMPQQLITAGNSLVLRTTDEVFFFDKNGSTQHSFTHRYTNPVLKSGGSRLLTYDRGGYGYRVDSSSGLHYSGRTESSLITGAISSRGSYALAVSETRYACSVIVSSRSNEEILRWYSVDDQIVDMSFSDDGSLLALACVGFEDNSLVAKVYILQVNKSTDEEKAVLTFDGAMPIAIDYKSDGSIHLICDSFVGVIASDLQSQQEISYSNSLYQYIFTSTRTILLSTDTSAVSFTLTSVDRSGNKEDVQVKGGGTDVCVDSNGMIYLLEKTSILTFDSSLELKKELATDSSVFAMAALGNKLYLLSDAQLARWEDTLVS
jgi:hypothetical protein